MISGPTSEIQAIVSIFMHIANADLKLKGEEIEVIFNAIHEFYPRPEEERLRLNEQIATFMHEPLSLKDSIALIKQSSTPLQSAVFLQTLLLSVSDGDVDFFEEAILKRVAQELFGTDPDNGIDELIAELKRQMSIPNK